jgi:hypothetical protein
MGFQLDKPLQTNSILLISLGINMKKSLFILGVPLALLVTDTVLSALLATGYGIIDRKGPYSLLSYPEGAVFLNFLRLCYFYLPTVLLYFIVSRLIHFSHNPLALSVINLLIYSSLCGISVLLVSSFGKDIITNPLFYIIGLSIIVSPCLLSISTRFKRVLALV